MKSIRLIHNLPRSGGTIISKCLAAQKDVILLSEIHREGVAMRKKMGGDATFFDPINQCQKWNNLFGDNEYKKICNSSYNFEEKIDLIYKKTELANKKLIIRDWAFLDFFGKPFIEPSYKNSLAEAFNKKFEILNLYIIRHPLELFISCYKTLDFFKYYDLSFFFNGYRNYFLNASKNNIFTYENFLLEPEKNLKNMCNILKVDYEDNYLSKLKDINLTGDPTAKNSLKIQNKDNIAEKLFKKDDLDKIKKSSEFINLMQDLKDYY